MTQGKRSPKSTHRYQAPLAGNVRPSTPVGGTADYDEDFTQNVGIQFVVLGWNSTFSQCGGGRHLSNRQTCLLKGEDELQLFLISLSCATKRELDLYRIDLRCALRKANWFIQSGGGRPELICKF